MTTVLNVDLHCHSRISDGLLSPADLVERAQRNGVDVLALTDHDELSGLGQAAEAARPLDMRFVPGVEISVTWAGSTVHIVGLRVDPLCPALVEGVRATRSGREMRGRDMAAQLDAVGIPGAFEGALEHVGNPQLISRTHFARFLVQIGVGKDISHVFQNYLVEGKPGYAPMRWATLANAVAWIREAGGTAVIAHPGRYDYTPTQFGAFFDEFLSLGGKGIEVVTGSHTPDQYKEYAQVARQYGFLASRGSDFHGPAESRVDLGQLPPLPADLTPVWHDWF
jgi:predicted metal-dependent phosphoesterase TrpH